MKKNIAILGAFLALAVPTFAQTYPLTIDHKFGSTVLEAQPKQIATVDYAGHDNILALGEKPLTTRLWFGNYPNAVWPWAQDLLSVEPEALSGQLNFEQIAKTNPDVIMAIRSGISAEEFEKLSEIAPVVAVPSGYGDYELQWHEQAQLAGRVLGKEDEALAKIEEIHTKIKSVSASHPEWDGKTFAMATYWNGSVGVYSAYDSSVKFIEGLGLTVAPSVENISKKGEFYVTISEEELPILDADVLFWFTTPESEEQIKNLPLRPTLKAAQEGREIMMSTNSIANGALSHGSLISLDAAIDALVPQIEAAIDGDPATIVVSK
jgi:iron complex transport system substrate-binding protein